MEYGSPSGHSLKSMGFALYTALDLSSQENGYNRKVLIIGACLYSFIVGLKRAFTIVHSFDQVLFGWSLGAWSALYFYNCIALVLKDHLNSIRLPDAKLVINYVKALLIFLFLLVLLFIVRLYSENFVIPNDWSINIKANCKRWVDNSTIDDPADLLRSFEDKDFISSCSYVALLGAYFSVTYLQPQYFPRSVLVQPAKGMIKLVYRFGVSLSLTLPLYFISISQSYSSADDVYLATLFETIIPYFVASVLVFTLSNYLFLKLDLAFPIQ